MFIDDILFKEPVEIGSVLMCSSQVRKQREKERSVLTPELQIVYSEGNRFQVRVYMEKRSPVTMAQPGVTTNVIHLTFECDDTVPKVVPRSYGEGTCGALVLLFRDTPFCNFQRI